MPYINGSSENRETKQWFDRLGSADSSQIGTQYYEHMSDAAFSQSHIPHHPTYIALIAIYGRGLSQYSEKWRVETITSFNSNWLVFGLTFSGEATHKPDPWVKYIVMMCSETNFMSASDTHQTSSKLAVFDSRYSEEYSVRVNERNTLFWINEYPTEKEMPLPREAIASGLCCSARNASSRCYTVRKMERALSYKATNA